MPINANTYNTRLTSEALEAAFRERFPAQGGAELVDDLYASGVIQPVFDLAATTAGSKLPVNLQTAWDFSTGSASRQAAGTTTLISNTGFWLIDLTCLGFASTASPVASATVRINDGSTTKPVWGVTTLNVGTTATGIGVENAFVVFLRAGDTLELNLTGTGYFSVDVWYRQIADVNGNVVNPLGFTF